MMMIVNKYEVLKNFKIYTMDQFGKISELVLKESKRKITKA